MLDGNFETRVQSYWVQAVLVVKIVCLIDRDIESLTENVVYWQSGEQVYEVRDKLDEIYSKFRRRVKHFHLVQD